MVVNGYWWLSMVINCWWWLMIFWSAYFSHVQHYGPCLAEKKNRFLCWSTFPFSENHDWKAWPCSDAKMPKRMNLLDLAFHDFAMPDQCAFWLAVSLEILRLIFPRKLLGMTWFDTVCLRLKYQLLWGLSTASLQLPWESRKTATIPSLIRKSGIGQGPRVKMKDPATGFLVFFLCRPSWPSHFLGQLWPRSSKKNKCGGSKPWLNESLPPKKDTTQMKPWFSSGSIAELGSHMEGMSYDICIYLLYLPISEYVFTNKQRITSPFQNAPFLSPIFYGYDAPFIRGWGFLGAVKHADLVKLAEKAFGGVKVPPTSWGFCFFKLIWPWINTYESPINTSDLGGWRSYKSQPWLMWREGVFLSRWLEHIPWPILISSFLWWMDHLPSGNLT